MPDLDQEIVNGLRRIYEALNRGDLDTAVEMAHPEIEAIPPIGRSPMRGRDAVRAWLEPDAIESQEIELGDLRVNGNRVLARQRVRARGAGSGIELDIETFAVWTLDDDGLVTRFEAFLLHEESQALKAAGLTG